MSDHYASFAELAMHAEEGRDYRRIMHRRDTAIAIIAPHGGSIEPGSSEITLALAGEEFSWYCFEGLRPDTSKYLHITSTRFDEPWGINLVRQAKIIVAIHGCRGKDGLIHVGGRHTALKKGLLRSFLSAGFQAIEDHSRHSGKDPRNICNRGRAGRGVQLEVDEGLRRMMFRGLQRAGRQHTTPLLEHFCRAVRRELVKWIEGDF